MDGVVDGRATGRIDVGTFELGSNEGLSECITVRRVVDASEGIELGSAVGSAVGSDEGIDVGNDNGLCVGRSDGLRKEDTAVGTVLGSSDGLKLGRAREGAKLSQ